MNESLQRLQTGFMDLHYAHYDDENVAVMSNFEPARMREWFETAKAEDLTLPVAIQPQHNLIHFALASGVLAEGKGVTAPVASASTPEQLPALMAAAELQLSAAEVR